MKKIKSFMFILIPLVAVFVTACGPLIDWGALAEDDNYKRVSKKVEFNKEDGDPDLYLFIYNKGDETVTKDKYAKILRSTPVRSAARNAIDFSEQIEDPYEFSEDDFSNYTCGLSLETIRNARKNSVINTNPKIRTADDDEDEDEYQQSRSYYKAAADLEEEYAFWTIYTDPDDGEESMELVLGECVHFNKVCQIFVKTGYFYQDEDGEWQLEQTEDTSYYEKNATRSFVYDKIDDYDSYKITDTGVKNLAEAFKKMYIPEQDLLGKANLDFTWNNNIIETSEKITILISNIGKKKTSATIGYFNPDDLRCDCNYLGITKDNIRTNQRLMFTINTIGYAEKFGGEDAVISTLAHEFNHMINYINKDIRYNTKSNETWFDEMLSVITEDVMAKIIGIPNTVQEARLPLFLRFPYNGMINWDGNDGSVYSYSYAYGFGAYLVRNYGGAKLLKTMATNSYRDKTAISNALKTCGYKDESYESVLLKFGKIFVNYDNHYTDSPSLYKSTTNTINSTTYEFDSINLYNFQTRTKNKDTLNGFLALYTNPKWSGTDTYGPCFYNINNVPPKIFAGGFYPVYLGKASDYNYELSFSTSSSTNIQAYIFSDYR